MKVCCNTNKYNFISSGEILEVLEETSASYVVKTRANGNQYYPKEYFDIVLPDLDELLEKAEAKVTELKKLIKLRDTVNIGDKFKHNETGDIYMVTFHYCDFKSSYGLNKIESKNDGIGNLWSASSSSIQKIFGGHKSEFTKL